MNYVLLIVRKFLAQCILAAEEGIPLRENIIYVIVVIAKFAPIAFILSGLHLWFADNQRFFSFVVIALVINMLMGAWRHKGENTFTWEKFFTKSTRMWLVILLAYPVLEMLRYLTGDNIVGEGLKVVIQVATFLYPGSKILKNAYILSNGQFPPEFIMKRLYNFEKTGNTDYLFKKEILDQERKEYSEDDKLPEKEEGRDV